LCHWLDTSDRQRGVLRRLVTGQIQYIVREGVQRLFVTGWTQLIVRKGYIDVWSLDRCSRSSARGSEMLGHWLDTADRQRRDTEMFGHWLNAVDCQSRDTEAFGYW